MEFLVWLVVAAATIIPMLKLLPHFGIEKWWALGCVLPVVTLILIWLMAMRLQEMEKR
jgi:membrane protein implicated in regulation of membrane protease activity